jgi:uncharacterized RDD family membrane protein YckC
VSKLPAPAPRGGDPQPALPPRGPPVGYGPQAQPAPPHRKPALAAFSFEGPPPRTPSLGRRAGAYLLDFILLGVVIVVLAVGAAVLRLLQPGAVDPASVGAAIIPVLLLAIPIFLVYFTLLEAAWGRTLGKAALGLRVERLTGGKPTLLESFVRNLLRLLWGPNLPSILLLFAGNAILLALGREPIVDVLAVVALAFLALDLWLIQGSEMEQRLGDLAAGTVVVEG